MTIILPKESGQIGAELDFKFSTEGMMADAENLRKQAIEQASKPLLDHTANPPIVTPEPPAPTPEPVAPAPSPLPSFDDLIAPVHPVADQPAPETVAAGTQTDAPTLDPLPMPAMPSMPTWKSLSEPPAAPQTDAGKGDAVWPDWAKRSMVASGGGGDGVAQGAASPTSGSAPFRPTAPAGDGEIETYIRQAARARGIDPDVAIAVADTEGGHTEPARRGTFSTGSSWWPFQLHYGGAGYEQYGDTAGMGNSFTAKTGIQPGDPNGWKQSVDYALDAAKTGGWGPWYGAKAIGITGMQGIGDAPVAGQSQAGSTLGAGGGNAVGTEAHGSTVPGIVRPDNAGSGPGPDNTGGPPLDSGFPAIEGSAQSQTDQVAPTHDDWATAAMPADFARLEAIRQEQMGGSRAMLADGAPDLSNSTNPANLASSTGTIKGVPIAEALAMGGQFDKWGNDGSNEVAVSGTDGGGNSQVDQTGVADSERTQREGQGGSLGSVVGEYPPADANGSTGPVRDDYRTNPGLTPQPAPTWQDTAEQPFTPDSSASPSPGAVDAPGGGALTSPPVEHPALSAIRGGFENVMSGLSSLFGGGGQDAPSAPQRPATPDNFNLPAAEQAAQHAGSVLPDATLSGMQAANAGFDTVKHGVGDVAQAGADKLVTMSDEQDALMAEYNDLSGRILGITPGGPLSSDEEWRLAQLTKDVGMGTFAGGLEGIGKLANVGLTSAGRRGAQEAIKAGAPGAEEALANAVPTLTESIGDFAKRNLPTAGRTVPEMASGIVSGAESAPASDRYYHGTGGDFARPDPGKFDANGLFGPGYYITDAAEVASDYGRNRTPAVVDDIKNVQGALSLSERVLENANAAGDANKIANAERMVAQDRARLDELLQRSDGVAGANIRPVDVPRDLNLLDADAPVTEEVFRAAEKQLAQWGTDPGWRMPTVTENGVTTVSVRGHELRSQIATEISNAGWKDPQAGANAILHSMGYDGIKYQGGQRIPMKDANGVDIEHNAIAIFPESLDKIRNATAGTPGGLLPETATPKGSPQAVDQAMAKLGGQAAYGGVAGGVSEAQNDPNATPTTIGTAALTGAAERAALGAARGKLGPGAGGTIARAVRATETMKQSGSPELKKLADMMDEPIPQAPPDGPPIASTAERIRQGIVRQMTDSNVTLNEIQKTAAGKAVPIEDLVTSYQRLNPESAVDMQIQHEIMPALREAGTDRTYASAIMTAQQNVDQAAVMGQRAEADFRLPTVARRESELDALRAEAEQLRTQGADVSVDLNSRIEKAQAAVDQAKEFVQPEEAKVKADALRAQADDVAQKAADGFNSQARVRLETQVRQLENRVERETKSQGAPGEDTFNALERAKTQLADEQQAESVARQQIAETERLRTEEQARRLEEQYASPKVAKLQDRLDTEMKRAESEIRSQGRRSETADRRIAAAQDALDAERQAEQVAAKQAGQTAQDTRAFTGSLNAAESQKALDDLKALRGPDYAKDEALAKTFWQFNDDTLALGEAGHLIPSKVAADLRSTYPHFSPTNIVKYVSTDGPGGVPMGKTVGLGDNGLKRLSEEGTTAAKQDAIEASVAARYDMMKRVHRNQVTEKFLDVAKQNADLGQHVQEIISMEQYQAQGKKIQPGQVLDVGRLTPDQTRIGYFDTSGVKHEYLVDDWAKPLIEGASVGEMNAYQKFLQEWRGSVTDRSISFTMRNAPRDLITVGNTMLAKEGGPLPANVKQVVVDLANGYRDAFKGVREGTFHGSTADYLESGGGYQRASGGGLEGQRQRVDDIARTGGLEIKNPLDLYHWITDPISELNKRLELGPRSAMYRQEMRKSGSDLRAVMTARDLMPYEVSGEWTKAVNRYVPFTTARIAGTMSQARLAQANPKAYVASAIMTGVIPAMAVEMYNRADQQRSDNYDQVPPYLKYLGNVVMLPWAGKDVYGQPLPNYLFLPTGVVGPWSILGHAVGAAVMGKGARPNDYAEMLDAITQSMAPVDTSGGSAVSQALGPVGSTAVGLMTNKDLFRGSNVATNQNDLEASRFGQTVAGGINAVGQKIPVIGPNVNVHPSQVDFATRGVGGQPGSAIIGASDIGRQRPGDSSNVQDMPVVGGLVSPLVGNRSGGVFTQESGRIMASRAGQIIRDSGVRWEPLPVDSMIGKVPLTRAEHGEVQRDTNQIFNQNVADVKKWVPNFDTLETAGKEQVLKNLYSNASQSAEQALMQRNPDKWKVPEQVHRVEILNQRKAG